MKSIESNIQQLCVRWFRLQFPTLTKLLFAIPNGGYRFEGTARRMKAEGVVAGVSDLILFVPSKGYHALCIEMKTEIGRQSELQRQWQIEVEKQGYRYVICRNVDDFRAEIINYLKY